MENPPALLPTENYEAIEAAVMETARGRWFLAEYARRNRQADTRAILDAIDELSRQVDNHPVGSGELELLRRINALAGFATRSRAALTIEVQGRETPLLRVALSMLAEIERKLQLLGGQEAEAEADFLSASEPAPRRAKVVSEPALDNTAEDELFAKAPASPADAVPEPVALAIEPEEPPESALADSSEADFDLFVAGDEAAEVVEEAAPAADVGEAPMPGVEGEADFAIAEALAELDAFVSEPSSDEPEPAEEVAAERIEEASEDDSLASPPVIAATMQEIDGVPRWVFARKPAPVPRIAEIDALSFEEKSVYFA